MEGTFLVSGVSMAHDDISKCGGFRQHLVTLAIGMGVSGSVQIVKANWNPSVTHVVSRDMSVVVQGSNTAVASFHSCLAKFKVRPPSAHHWHIFSCFCLMAK